MRNWETQQRKMTNVQTDKYEYTFGGAYDIKGTKKKTPSKS